MVSELLLSLTMYDIGIDQTFKLTDFSIDSKMVLIYSKLFRAVNSMNSM